MIHTTVTVVTTSRTHRKLTMTPHSPIPQTLLNSPKLIHPYIPHLLPGPSIYLQVRKYDITKPVKPPPASPTLCTDPQLVLVLLPPTSSFYPSLPPCLPPSVHPSVQSARTRTRCPSPTPARPTWLSPQATRIIHTPARTRTKVLRV